MLIPTSSILALNNGVPEDSLLPPGHASLLLVGGRGHSLQLEAGHGALGHGGALLQVLQKNNVLGHSLNQLAALTEPNCTWKTSLPPGVLTTFLLLLFVL